MQPDSATIRHDVATRDDRTLTLRLRRPAPFPIAVAVVAVWGALANFARLGYPGSGLDERIYAVAGWRYVHGETGAPPSGLASNFDNFEHPPVAKYLFGFAELFAGHPSVVAARVVSALCTLGTAVVLGLWLGRVAGRWIGLGAAALVAVLPMGVPILHVPFRFGRYAYLDPVAELFAVGSVVLAWMWFRRYGRDAWMFAAAAGGCVGLATACKETAFLGVVGPVIVGLLFAGRRDRAALTRAVQTVVAAVVAALVFALTYAGLGNPARAVGFLLRFQRSHAASGHPVQFAGRTSVHPPGWAFLWFAQHGVGAVTAVVCLICAIAAVGLRRDRLVLWCLAALVGPLIFHMAIARVILSFYWVMWMPFLLALVALGAAELLKLAASANRAQRFGGVGLAALSGCVLVAASAHDTYRTLTLAVPHQLSYSATVHKYVPLTELPLDDRTGTRAVDASGHDHVATYAGSPRLGAHSLLTGAPGTSVVFNRFQQYATIPGAPWMDVRNYSFSLWFSGSRPAEYLVSRDTYVTKVWNLQLDPAGHLSFVTYASFGGAAQVLSSRAAYDDGRPHLAVGVKQGTGMWLYVDGRLVGSASFPSFARSTTASLDLARRGNGSGYFAGALDEFAYYDVALSAGDVRTLYQAGTQAAGASD